MHLQQRPFTRAQRSVSLVATYFLRCISLSCHTSKSIQERLIEVSKWKYFAHYFLKPRVYGEFISINVACCMLHVQYTHSTIGRDRTKHLGHFDVPSPVCTFDLKNTICTFSLAVAMQAKNNNSPSCVFFLQRCHDLTQL